MARKRAVVLGADARLGLKAGVDLVAGAVKVTLGPKGRNVAYKPGLGPPRISNDGVTVVREIRLANNLLHTGAAIVYEACRITNRLAGDGTSTAAVLTQAMFAGALRAVAGGANPMALRRGMAAALTRADAALRAQAVRVTGASAAARIAALSAHDPAIGERIAEVFQRQGRDAAVIVEESPAMGVTVRYVEGMRIDRGLASAHLAAAAASEVALDHADVLVTDRQLDDLPAFLPFLDAYVEHGGRRLLVVAARVGGGVLGAVVANVTRGSLQAVCVNGPAFGQRQRWMLEDLAVFTGSELVGRESGAGWRQVPLRVLGSAARVHATLDETLVVRGGGDPGAVRDRSEYLWLQHGRARNQFDREKLEERANNLRAAISHIQVGAPTELERFELRHRVEDAVAATRAGLRHGVVPGGGTALVRASSALEPPDHARPEEAAGWRIVRAALTAPTEIMAANAGFSGPAVVAGVRAQTADRVGFDVLRGEHRDLIEAGIVDPLAVVRAALRNAGSAAMLLATSETVVTDAASIRDWRRSRHPGGRAARRSGAVRP